MRRFNWPASLRVLGKSIVDWWDGWLDFVMLTLIWLPAQLTIILGPAATFGMFYVINLMVREGEATGIKGMIRGGRMFFWKSLLWGAINWLVVLIGYVAITFYAQLNSFVGSLAMWVVIILMALFFLAQFYAVPFFMQMEDAYKKVLVSIRNGFFLGMGTLPFTFILVVVCLLLMGISLGLIIPLFLGAPALVAMISTRGMVDRLEYLKLIRKDPDPREIP